MKKTLTLRLPEEIVLRAKAAGIELCMPVENECVTTFEDDCIPDVRGVCIGKVNKETDKLESYIKDDANGDILRAYIDNGLVITKIFNQMINKKLTSVPHYFMIYNVMESSKYQQTYTESTAGNGTPDNMHYECKYEVLLGSEEYTRRMVFDIDTVNISMYEWLHILMDDIVNGENYVDKHFYKNTEDIRCFTMFDEVGIAQEIEYYETDFVSMIVGVRQLSCQLVSDEGEKH